MKFLVTGSREWRETHIIYRALTDEVTQDDLMLVGNARGVDMIAATFWLHYATTPDLVKVYEPNWALGSYAGPLRNQAMVDEGPGLVLAFLMRCTDITCKRPRPHGTHGTAGCIRMAQRRGIKTLIFNPSEGGQTWPGQT